MIEKWLFLLLALILTIEGKSLPRSEANVPTIISRSEWGAKKALGQAEPLQETPPSYVVVHHAASETCITQAICQARVRAFQSYHMNKKNWSDIGYHFLVAEDGNVYEGRGWDKAGTHTKGYNHKSIGICIIGNYENILPNAAATKAIANLISYGVSQGKIKEKYSLIGHRQAWTTSCPGTKLYQFLQTWPNWIKNI